MNDIEKIKSFNNKQVLSIIAFVILITGYVVTAWWQNEQLKEEVKVLNNRLDKKITIINQNTNEINKLKQSH